MNLSFFRVVKMMSSLPIHQNIIILHRILKLVIQRLIYFYWLSIFTIFSYFYFFPVVTPLVVILLPIGQNTRQQKRELADIKEKHSEVVSNS